MSPEVQEEAAKKLEESRRKAAMMGQLTRKTTRSTLDMRGVLTVTVHRCINLQVGSRGEWTGEWKGNSQRA